MCAFGDNISSMNKHVFRWVKVQVVQEFTNKRLSQEYRGKHRYAP